MSSTYRLLCLSHDPAISLDYDLSRDAIEHVRRSHEAVTGHEDCDLLAGRFSYPLIETGCFGMSLPGPTGCKGHHSGVNWADSDWLRLLYAAAIPSPLVAGELLSPFTARCWTPERLKRLRAELGIAQP